MKKVLCLILALSMVLPFSLNVMAASTEEIEVYSETFDSYGVDSEGPKNITISTGGNARITENGKGGKALAYDLNLSYGSLLIPFNAAGSFVHASTQIKIHENIDEGKLFTFTDTAGNAFTALTIDKGSFFLNDNRTFNKVPNKRWVQLDVVVDITNAKFDVYVDGIRYADNVRIGVDGFTTPMSVEHNFTNSKKVAVVYFDNLSVKYSEEDVDKIYAYPKGTDDATITPDDSVVAGEKITDVYLYDTFDATSGTPSSAFTLYNNKRGIHGGEGVNHDGYFRIDANAGSPGPNAKINQAYSTMRFTIKPITAKQFVIDVCLRVPYCDGWCEPLKIRDSDDDRYNLLIMASASYPTGDGIYTSDGKVVKSMVPNQWTRFQFVIDMNKKTYDLYSDGMLELEGLTIPANIDDIKYIDSGVDHGVLHIDNYAVYEGTEPLKELKHEELLRYNQSRFNDVTDKLVKYIGNKTVLSMETQSFYHNGKRVKLREHGTYSQGVAMFSLNTLAEGFGFSVSYEPQNRRAIIDGNKIISLDSNIAYVNGKEAKMDFAPYVKENGDFMVPVNSFLQNVMGKYTVMNDKNGLIFVDDVPFSIPDADINNEELMLQMLNFMVYDDISQEEIINTVKERWPNKQHPRISVKQDQLEYLREQVKLIKAGKPADKWVEAYFSVYEKNTNEMLNRRPIQYDGKATGISYARTIESAIMALSYMYLLTDDEKYAEAAWKWMENTCNFPSWVAEAAPLNNGAITVGMGCGYDWLYNWMNEDQRKLVRENIKNKTMAHYLKHYMGTLQDAGFNFITADTNWTAVCQGSLILAALAVVDEEDCEKDATYILENAIRGIRYVLNQVRKDDGASSESTSYWSYQHIYLSKGIDAVKSVLGTDLGYYDTKGFENAAKSIMAAFGPAGTYNFHDAGGTTNYMTRMKPGSEPINPITLYTREYKDSATLTNYINYFLDSGFYSDIMQPHGLIWYDPSLYNAVDENATLYSDILVRGELIEFAALSGNSHDNNRAFIAYNGGATNASHSHYDPGAFVFHSDKTVWFDDLGAEDYEAKKTLFRKYPESHNMYVINPRAGYPGVKLSSNAITNEQVSGDKEAYMTLNLSDAYSEDVTQATRGYKLVENRTAAVIRDEFSLKKFSKVYWFAHTLHDIKIIDNNTAILTRGKDRLHVRVDTNAPNFTLKVMDTVPFPTTQHDPSGGGRSNALFKRLAIEMDVGGNVYVNVKMTPLYEDNQVIYPDNEYISEWKVEEGENNRPYINNLYVNGAEVADFDKMNTRLEIKVPDGKVPQITANADSNYNVEVKAPQTIFDRGLIKVTDKNDSKNVTYYTLDFLPEATKREIGNKHKILSISKRTHDEYETYGVVSRPATYITDATGVLTDNSFDTSSDTKLYDTYYTIDLGSNVNVNYLNIAFKEPECEYWFNIAYSLDGVNYTSINNVKSTKNAEGIMSYNLGGINARYIRVIGNGQRENNLFKPAEMSVE